VNPDILVVGGGPAGATAALTLARGGAHVCLLDKAKYPRHKPCGGAISMRTLSRFPYLPSALERIPARRLSKLYLESPSGQSVLLTSHRPAALMVRRIEFDRLLVDLAREAGVELIEGAEISGAEERDHEVRLRARDGREFVAPRVVAADGVNSVVARRIRLNDGWSPSRIALDMMEETPAQTLRSIDPDMLWVAYGYEGADGYAYVFPKATHVNVGIGYVLEWYKSHGRDHPYELQRRFVDTLRARGVLDGSSKRETFTPFLIPVGGPLRRVATRRVALAGDAGGFVNGITAEGIYYAMVSGDLAARAALAGDFARYERSWRTEIGAELRDAVLVQRYLFGAPGRIDAVTAAARRRPDLADVVIRYAMGEVPYTTARWQVLRRAPLAAVALAISGLLKKGSGGFSAGQ
jgi:geranylgeranyl reductase family protein